jgi:DNA polymerase elongation subunit (family B)
MFTPTELQKMVFFDLETAPNYSSLDELNLANPAMATLWSKRCEYLRARFEENRELSDEELYIEKAALAPEFNRIVCATFGRLSFTSNELSTEVMPSLVLKSYSSTEESEILDGIEKVFTSFAAYKFVGHNIKRFDIPVMCKRLLISGRSLPKGLQIQNLKPWEMPFIDTSELWSFGAWQEGFVSLELLVTSLGLTSPKDDIEGADVGRVFWEERDLSRIVKYCEKDVLSGVQAILKLSSLPIVEDYQLQK